MLSYVEDLQKLCFNSCPVILILLWSPRLTVHVNLLLNYQKQEYKEYYLPFIAKRMFSLLISVLGIWSVVLDFTQIHEGSDHVKRCQARTQSYKQANTCQEYRNNRAYLISCAIEQQLNKCLLLDWTAVTARNLMVH